jgi:hypothetical protein
MVAWGLMLLAVCAAAPAAGGAATTVGDAPHDGQRDFDFLLGSWITEQTRTEDSPVPRAQGAHGLP